MKEQLKSFVKQSPFLLKTIRNIREGKLFKKPYSKSVKGKNNILKIKTSARLNNCKIDVVGNSNQITIESESLLNNVIIFIRGNNNQITISKEVKFNRSGELWIEDDFCELYIGENSTFEETHIAVTEPNSKITIGIDCMFANDIDIRTGDSHSIIDTKSNKRINHAQDVVIADHVWVGAHTSILKGSGLATNSIVATRSVVTKRFEEQGVLIAGIPAKVIKQDITWDRKRIY
ncbi:acyltransferase [Maribacter sp. 2308TA10-17]|uniref:acyltransferase n=1 Tax=Maribacter sp. 2308TA10-17 TaxID=3386276 RepID=UPI0039BC8CC0